MCLPPNFNLTLKGSLDGTKAEVFGFKADYCKQFILD
jgi:hypothetical protein